MLRRFQLHAVAYSFFVEPPGFEPGSKRCPRFVFLQAYRISCFRKQGPTLPPDMSTSPFYVRTNVVKAFLTVTAHAAAFSPYHAPLTAAGVKGTTLLSFRRLRKVATCLNYSLLIAVKSCRPQSTLQIYKISEVLKNFQVQ